MLNFTTVVMWNELLLLLINVAGTKLLTVLITTNSKLCSCIITEQSEHDQQWQGFASHMVLAWTFLDNICHLESLLVNQVDTSLSLLRATSTYIKSIKRVSHSYTTQPLKKL